MNFYGYYTTPLGLLKVACTQDYVTQVLFVADEESKTTPQHPLLSKTFEQLDEFFGGSRTVFDLPLQQPGSLFQLKVWKLLTQIPFGKTLSYSQLAKAYGDLKAIRAVASANGKNQLSIIIPCHRVIGSNGSLTGYAGGLWRKKWLLEHEAKYAAGVMKLFPEQVS